VQNRAQFVRGLKGQLSEIELFTIRARLTAGLLQKARRGDLAQQLPVGLVRDEQERVQKDPHLDVQQRIELVFALFLELKSASKVAQRMNQKELLLPRYDRFGDLLWRRPTIGAVLLLLRNPAYAGAFVYGRRQSVRQDLARRPLNRATSESDTHATAEEGRAVCLFRACVTSAA
jgi:Recombinase